MNRLMQRPQCHRCFTEKTARRHSFWFEAGRATADRIPPTTEFPNTLLNSGMKIVLVSTSCCVDPNFRNETRGTRRFAKRGNMMTQPTPAPIDPAQLPELAQRVVHADRFPYLATIDGDQPRLRPVSPVRTDGFVVYVANLKPYHKTAEITANPKVELGYMDEHHDQVRITGVAGIVTDAGLLQEIWDANPLLRQYLGTIDNPNLIVYRIEPNCVRFMQEWALEYHVVPLS